MTTHKEQFNSTLETLLSNGDDRFDAMDDADRHSLTADFIQRDNTTIRGCPVCYEVEAIQETKAFEALCPVIMDWMRGGPDIEVQWLLRDMADELAETYAEDIQDHLDAAREQAADNAA